MYSPGFGETTKQEKHYLLSMCQQLEKNPLFWFKYNLFIYNLQATQSIV